MPGGELALRLFAAFRTLVDRTHAELAEHGHPHVRPVHGFALRAVGPDGATAGELATRLGVTKQAAGKTVDALIALGYVDRSVDAADGRRKIVHLTPTGTEVLRLSAHGFDRALADRFAPLDPQDRAVFEDVLRRMTADLAPRADAAAWLAGTGTADGA